MNPVFYRVIRKACGGSPSSFIRSQLSNCLLITCSIAAMLVVCPLTASPFTCNSTRSMAYPCLDLVADSAGDNGVGALLSSQPYLAAYVREQAFGHCSWAGGIVYRCPQILTGGSTGPAVEPSDGTPDSPPGGGPIEDPSPTLVPEPRTILPVAVTAMAALLIRRKSTKAILSKGRS